MSEYFSHYAESNIACAVIFAIMLVHDLMSVDRQEKQIKYDHVLITFMMYFLVDCLWAEMIEGYLRQSRNLKRVFLLVDIRHAPTTDDQLMVEYLRHYEIPFTVVATKADKVSKSKRQPSANQNAKLVGAPPWGLPFSRETGEGRQALLDRLGSIVSEKLPSPKENEAEPLTEP